MKVLFISKEFPPFSGGAGIYAFDLATGLYKNQVDITVIAPYYNYDCITFDQENSFKTIRIHSKKRFRWLTNIVKQIKIIKPDILHATDAESQILLSMLSPFYKIKKFVTVHGTEINNFFTITTKNSIKKRIKKVLIKKLYVNANAVICVSNSTKTNLDKMISNINSIVVYNGINFEKFYSYSIEKMQQIKKYHDLSYPVLLSVSRLEKEKGNDVVIDVIEKLKVDYPKIKYLIVGDGDAKEYLRQIVKTKNLEENVFFVGNVDQKELANYYSVSDIFVLPSRRGIKESFGLIYIEASWFELSIVGTNHGGVPEVIVDNETGYTPNPESLDEIERVIRECLENTIKSKIMSKKAKQRALNMFSSDIMAKNTYETYKKN
jgi:glycosyltransferase involved in cell wall biosynthesis